MRLIHASKILDDPQFPVLSSTWCGKALLYYHDHTTFIEQITCTECLDALKQNGSIDAELRLSALEQVRLGAESKLVRGSWPREKNKNFWTRYAENETWWKEKKA